MINAVADRNDAEAIRAALAGRSFDAVFDVAYDWERGPTAEQVVGTVKAVPGNLCRYIFVSSSVAYVPGIGLMETDPLMSDEDAPNPYVRNKAASERALFVLGVPLVTVRPPYVYGPDNPFYRESFFFERISDGRPVVMPGGGDRLLQFVFVDDLARVLVRALYDEAAVGQAFNVAHESPVTQAELVRVIAAGLGREADVRPVPKEVIERNGGYKFGCPPYFGNFGQYYNRVTLTQDVGKLKVVLGMEPSSFEESMRRTAEHWLLHGVSTGQDFAFEDRLIQEAAQCAL